MLSSRFAKDCAGIVDKNINDWKFGAHFCNKLANGVTVSQVAAISSKPASQCRYFLLNRATARFKCLANADNVGTGLSERQRKRFADASATTCHQRGSSIQLEQFENVHVLQCSWGRVGGSQAHQPRGWTY